MKTAILVVLVLSLVTSVVPVAAQDRFVSAPGPIASSITSEAARIAASQTKAEADDLAWASLQKIDRDTEVDVLDRAGTVTRGRLAEVDGASVRLLDGVLSTRIARRDVVEISTPRGGGSSPGAAGGVALGILAGLAITAAIASSPCGGSCGGEKILMGVTMVGLPVGLGFAGYHAANRTKSRVIYSASQSGADVAGSTADLP